MASRSATSCRWQTHGVHRIRFQNQCAMGPKEVNVADAVKGKKIGYSLARGIHAHLLGEARAGLYAERRTAQSKA